MHFLVSILVLIISASWTFTHLVKLLIKEIILFYNSNFVIIKITPTSSNFQLTNFQRKNLTKTYLLTLVEIQKIVLYIYKIQISYLLWVYLSVVNSLFFLSFLLLSVVWQALYVHDNGHTCQYPFSWWVSCLQLGCEHICRTSVLCFVSWALINCLVFLSFTRNR